MKMIKTDLCGNQPIILKATKDMMYLSEVLKELPSNTLFDKGKTGCGGTELELRANRHSIIAVPNM